MLDILNLGERHDLHSKIVEKVATLVIFCVFGSMVLGTIFYGVYLKAIGYEFIKTGITLCAKEAIPVLRCKSGMQWYVLKAVLLQYPSAAPDES